MRKLKTPEEIIKQYEDLVGSVFISPQGLIEIIKYAQIDAIEFVAINVKSSVLNLITE